MTKTKPQATLFAEPEENPKLTSAQKPKAGRSAPQQPKAAPTKTKPKPAPKVVKAVAAPASNIVPLQRTPTNTLALLADSLKDPNFKPENLRAVLDMHKEMVLEEARVAFITDFIAMAAEMPYINADNKIEIVGKEGTRDAGKVIQSTPYASYPNIHRVTKPTLQKYGFAMNFPAKPNAAGDRLIVVGTLMHRRGHVQTTEFPLPAEPSGSKNNVQGWGSSFSYGRRYGAIGLLNIVSDAKQDQDRNGYGEDAKVVEARPTIDAEQLETLTAQVEASVGIERFCEKYKIAAIKELPAERYDEAVLACQNFVTERNRKKQSNG